MSEAYRRNLETNTEDLTDALRDVLIGYLDQDNAGHLSVGTSLPITRQDGTQLNLTVSHDNPFPPHSLYQKLRQFRQAANNYTHGVIVGMPTTNPSEHSTHLGVSATNGSRRVYSSDITGYTDATTEILKLRGEKI